MSHPVIDPGDIRTSEYIITHVFCPLRLPSADDQSIRNDYSLATAITTAARLYTNHVDQASIPQWNSISRMLESLQATFQSDSLDEFRTVSQFSSMDVGDSLAFLIRAQNAGVIFRKQTSVTIFESFEVSPKAKDVMATQGKLVCSYPGPAIQVPNLVFDDKDFLSELVNFLVHMNDDDLEPVTNQKDASPAFQDTVHPRYITELLTGILRSVGSPANIPRISKRVGDDVLCNENSKLRPWRRSALWLLIRVALQTTLDRSPLGSDTYKEFMLFFMCCLAEERFCAGLPNDLLHFMAAKLSRRLQKLGPSVPDWLSHTVLEICTRLRATIENRWRQVQVAQRVSPPWNPSQLDLTQDIQLSLESSKDYLRNCLLDQSIVHPRMQFNPINHPRATLDGLLSSHGGLFDKHYRIEPHITLWDVEQAVEQGIDAWVARVTNNVEACEKLEILAQKYSSSASETYKNNPELLSVMLLTTIELWIALDRLVVKEIPILADYSPEVPTSLLENLLLCKAASLHRLRCAYEYLSRRHSRCRSQWSVFSLETTADSFSVRCYQKTSYLRRLKAQIEEDASCKVREKVVELQRKNAVFAEFQKKLQRQNAAVAELWEKSTELQRENEAVAELPEKVASLQRQNAAVSELQKLIDLIAELQRKNGAVAKLQKLVAELQRKNVAVAELQEKVTKLQRENVAVAELQEKVAELLRKNVAVAELQEKVAETQRQNVFAELQRRNTIVAGLQMKVTELERKKEVIAELQKKVAELQTAVAEFQKSNISWDYGDRQIDVYEWPLPANQFEAEAIVFELGCPVSFEAWRAATLHFLVDLCSPPIQHRSRHPRIQLSNYIPLQPYLVRHPRSRITLGSDSRSPHPSLPIPAKREEVCGIKNTSVFFRFDTHTGIYPISKMLGHSSSRSYCTYKLQSGPYHNLQKYVESTSHTSNEVIANQTECHKDVSIHEYMAFGHLRSGGLLQWLNILREIRGRLMSFRCQEVHTLLAQAVSQVGPLGSMGFMWHQEIKQPAFCYALLEELRRLIQDVSSSWQEVVTMDTISLLLRRILASGPEGAVLLKALNLLRTVRIMVFSWLRELSARLLKTPGDEKFRGALRDAAAICRSTFDVDPALIPDLLCSVDDVEVLLTSAIIIRNHTPGVASLPTYSRLLLERDRRLSLALAGALSNIIQYSSDQGVSLAVRSIWPDFYSSSKWILESQTPDSPWFSSTAVPSAGQPPRRVHLNILDGSLLVDGEPLGTWLPKEYVQHPLYKLIFSERMEVSPSNLPGMDYSTTNLISGHQVYFSLRNHGSDLVIRARRKQMDTSNSDILELIPHDKLDGDLPVTLIDGHVHWLSLSTSSIEIRPLSSPWEASSKNWKIDYTSGYYRMWKGREHLVDIRSQSWNMVSELLKPLATPQELIVSVSPVDASQPASLQLSVVLPYYGLSFYVDEDGDFQSHNMQGLVYDENQSIGTLFGLATRLVLRPKIRGTTVVELIPRCVLIPDGDISFRKSDDHHIRVEIVPQRSHLRRVTYQAYRVNSDLCCLTGNGSLTSALYCAYLHALTGGCSTDPLTGRSGAEEALSVLRSAGCWSTMRLSSRDSELLCLIASVCPLRTWSSQQFVQKVERDNVPAHLLNSQLYILSKAIKEHHERVLQLHGGQSSSDLFQTFPVQDDHLLMRGAKRAAHLRPISELSEKPFASTSDTQYIARDLLEIPSREHHVCIVAACVYSRTATGTKDLYKMAQSWVKTVSRQHGNAVSLRYDRSWLAPDFPLTWLNIYSLLRESDERKWLQMLFSLPAMAYASDDFSELVPVFVAFASHSQFRFEGPPPYDSFPIFMGCQPSRLILCKYVLDCAHSFARIPENWENVENGYGCYGDPEAESRFRMADESRKRSDSNAAAQTLLDAWPCETPPSFSLNPNLYDVVTLKSKFQSYVSSCYRNLRFREHLTRVQMILDDLHSQASPDPEPPSYSVYPSHGIRTTHPRPTMALDQLFTRPALLLRAHDRLPSPHTVDAARSVNPLSESGPLHQLITTVEANAITVFQRQYVSALWTSAECFGSDQSLVAHEKTKLPSLETLLRHFASCKSEYVDVLQQLQDHLGPRSRIEQAVEQSGQWPRITAYTLFGFLASNSPTILPDDWKKCLVAFTLLALELQRARRLLLLHFNSLHEDFWRELQNEGCDGWDAESCPDWLLIQLQGNFLIRRVQAEVANEMISPHSGDNTAMQLNMGEGKTSVIVPIVAAVLANGCKLVRVIVPKALAAQTLRVLTDRLSGLANRRIYYLPFSRSSEANPENVAFLRQTTLKCMQERGVLMLQPEHILSLKLVSVEKQLSRAEDDRMADLLLELQRWLHSHGRDILDESDTILDTRSQLVFTIGRHQHMEGSPERWTITEQVLGFVGRHATSLRTLFPTGVEYEPGPPGSFPHLRILRADAGQKLISWIVQDVIEGLLPSVKLGQLHLHLGLRNAIRSFMSCEDVPHRKIQLVRTHYAQTPWWSNLLLLRGLLAHGILLFAFRERRWRVDYGLSPTRTQLAVPYRAKDVPAQRAEFSHPDVAIILTCLSYHYGGLSEEQLRLSFQILFKQHDPFLDYSLWIRDCPAVPDSLRTLRGVNVESAEQWNKVLFPLFSRNQATVVFYLSKVVFPREAKVFPSKLTSSGWDLAEKKGSLLTGFSGTNDGQYLLPLHITQRDPYHQQGTNAKVLSYLLQTENKQYLCMAHKNGKLRTTREFIQVLVAQKPEIRVLLDIGAQMLDLQNHELAQAWLAIAHSSSAAIYFNDDDELMVCTRDGSTQNLQSSPFAHQLDQCVVYLDDAHTRGIDIKFPSGFRAAVTLGPRVTKDHLVQGCMRMRKLGHGHSIMFFAPLEVDRHIRSVARKDKDPSDVIDTMDILHWTIQETWQDIQQRAHHWAEQGIDHISRYTAWSDFCDGRVTPKELTDKWLKPEAKGLKDLYEQRTSSSSSLPSIPDIRQRCINLGVLSLRSCMAEEQERELVYEVKPTDERKIGVVPKVLPASHSVHKDVTEFVRTGVIQKFSKHFSAARSEAFSPAFDTLDATSAATDEAYIWSQCVLTTKDFEETVTTSEKTDGYLRPVHWIVSAKNGSTNVLVILSPHEVNSLLPDIRSRKKVHLHIYSPRLLGQMKPCDDLGLYSIPTVPKGWTPPSQLMDQLNVFSGQLYLKNYEAYVRLCRFLCVFTGDALAQRKEGIKVESDGFILPINRKRPDDQDPIHHTFLKSPLVAIKALLDLRSKGIDFTSTHMGKLVSGQRLSEADFDD